MRVPYPERIPYNYAAYFATALFLVQLLERTNVLFAVCCFGYVMVAVTGFNIAGGMYRIAGAYILFNSVLTLELALVVKAFLGEPADSNLVSPLSAIEVYLLGMVAMLIAAYADTRLRPRRGLVARMFPLTDLRGAYIGSAILGLCANFYWLSGAQVSAGSIASALHNSDALLPFSLILGVIYTVRSTNGRRSVSVPLGIMFVWLTIEALTYFSKQALFTPAFCWVLGVGLARYKLKPANIIIFLFVLYLAAAYGTPYVQVGKARDKVGGLQGNIHLAITLLSNMSAVRAEYKEGSAGQYNQVNYFNHPEGVFDRLEMFSIDDLLIDETNQHGVFGYEPVKESMENLIPHIIWKNKPIPYFGNAYAHELGLLADDDGSTGISFGVTADLYHQGGFFGVVVVQTLCFIFIFTALSWIVGDLRDHPAVLVLILVSAHAAPEGAISGALGLITYSAVVLAVGFVCRYVFPVIAGIFQSPPLPDSPFAPPALAAD